MRHVPVALVLLGIVVAASALRFYCLDCQGLWYDETASIDVARRGVVAILTDRFGWMRVQTPLHYLITWLAIQSIDPAASAIFVRLPSALAGLLTPFAVYGLGRETFGRAQGLLAALMVAISAVHISHSQDVRPYVFLALFTTVSVYCLLMCERTGRAKWWAAFAAATLANILLTYHALTLAMPAIAPYLLWVLYRTWQGRHSKEDGHTSLLPLAVSLLVIAVACALVLLDIMGVPRVSPDLTRFSLSSVGDMLGRVLNRLGQVGIEREAEKTLQWTVALIAGVGAAVGLRQHMRAVLLCASMLLVPTILMAVLRTTNTVFQRYVLFTMPFYFLLIANAVVVLWRLSPGGVAWTGKLVGGAVGAGVLMVLLTGLAVYFSPEGHRQLSFLPDYRGAAGYLSGVAKKDDLIVLVDDPPQSMQVFDLYWHGAAPAPTFDAIDPRLAAQPQPRHIFWVLNYEQNDPQYVAALLQSFAPAVPRVHTFDRLLVLEETEPASVLASLEQMQARVAAVAPPFGGSAQAIYTLQGAVLQAQGDVEGAAQAYRQAGPFYLMGEEYLQTARGFMQRGDAASAWREAIMSRFMQPERPQIHTWTAEMLRQAGYPRQATAEQQIADALSR